MKKKYLALSLFLLVSYPAGYLSGAVYDTSEELIAKAVVKLIHKVRELEKRIESLERKIKELRERENPFVEEGFVREKYLVKAKKLRVRACPSFRCRVVFYFNQGEIVEKLKVYGEWFKVRSVDGGKEGWVYSRYLLPY